MYFSKTKASDLYTQIPDVASDLNVTEITTSPLFLNWSEPTGDQWSNKSITFFYSTTSNALLISVTDVITFS